MFRYLSLSLLVMASLATTRPVLAADRPFNYQYNNHTAAFTTVVAYMNFLGAPIIFLGNHMGCKFISYITKRTDKKTAAKLAELGNLEEKLRIELTTIIKEFQNGIGEKTDGVVVNWLIEKLNQYRCTHCIENFVEIVGKHFPKEQWQDAKTNRKAFHNLANHHSPKCSCQGHDFAGVDKKSKSESSEAVSSEQQGSAYNICQSRVHSCLDYGASLCHKAKQAFLWQWDHASHWSSWSYMVGGTILTIFVGLNLPDESFSGSIIGDWANVSNTWNIYLGPLLVLGQKWLSQDLTAQDQFIEEFLEKVSNLSGMIETFARVVGKMDNKISVDEARTIVTILLITEWQKEPVAYFTGVASKQEGFDKAKLFDMLKEAYKNKKIPYQDERIDEFFKECPLTEIMVTEKDDEKDDKDKIIVDMNAAL